MRVIHSVIAAATAFSAPSAQAEDSKLEIEDQAYAAKK